MKCQECVNWCKEQGGFCAPMDTEEGMGLDEMGVDWRADVARHKERAHNMILGGAIWRCERGHETEATPTETMHAAGIRPLL